MSDDIVKAYFAATEITTSDPDRIENLVKNAKLKVIDGFYIGDNIAFRVDDAFTYIVNVNLIPFEDRKFFIAVHNPYKTLKLKGTGKGTTKLN